MRKLLKLIAVSAALGAAFPAAAAPTLLVSSDAASYSGPVLNLTGYNNGAYNFTFGPKFLPNGITFEAFPGGGGGSGLGSVIGQGGYGLGHSDGNGSLGDAATYIGVDSATGYAELTFATPVSSFGGYWNYYQTYDLDSGIYFYDGDTPTLSAYNANGDLIASYDLFTMAPISTPGGFNQFVFRGISDDTADITTIRFGGSYIALAGTADGSLPAIPEPETYAMLLAGLGVLGLVVRRRRKQA